MHQLKRIYSTCNVFWRSQRLLYDQGNVDLISKALDDSKIRIRPSFFDRYIGNRLDQNGLLS
uniref:Uncharacterized protein n=1 Tax=Romanomermis culicivorax TaxID=13658 RepID=A0A915IA13_ROMCU